VKQRFGCGRGRLLLAAFFLLPAVAVGLSHAETAVVEEVTDGDTLRVLVGTATATVRMIGIDAPERSHPSIGREFYGNEAAAYLSTLCLGKTVRMEKGEEESDRYDRLLRYVFLPAPDDRLLNLEMLRAGMARAYSRYPFSRREEFLAAESLARREGKGIWKDGGAAEARWLVAGSARPVEVYPAGGRKFVVAYRGWARNGIGRGELTKEIEWVVRAGSELSDAEFARRARERGYHPVDPARDVSPGVPVTARKAAPPGGVVVPWEEAHRHAGEEIVVEGTVVRTYRTATMLYLNFHTNWKRYLTVVIHDKDLQRFPKDPEAAFRGKKIRARGEVRLYKDRPEMVIRDPGDITVVP
jgi:endonuclease YncB( thermonuclease family)